MQGLYAVGKESFPDFPFQLVPVVQIKNLIKFHAVLVQELKQFTRPYALVFGFSVQKDGVTFHTAEDFAPYLLLKNGTRLPLSAAATQNTVPYPSGVGDGILTTLSDFPDLHLSIALYVWLEEINGRLHTELIPLEEDFTINKNKYMNTGKFTVIANPNAPTGLELGLDVIEEIIASNKDNVVLIDEAYVDFGGTSCYELIKKYDDSETVRPFVNGVLNAVLKEKNAGGNN